MSYGIGSVDNYVSTFTKHWEQESFNNYEATSCYNSIHTFKQVERLLSISDQAAFCTQIRRYVAHQKPEMFNNYFKTAFRFLLKNKGFIIINILRPAQEFYLLPSLIVFRQSKARLPIRKKFECA